LTINICFIYNIFIYRYFDELSLLAKLQDLKYPKVDATTAITIAIDDTNIEG
jgi:hypothetical protein